MESYLHLFSFQQRSAALVNAGLRALSCMEPLSPFFGAINGGTCPRACMGEHDGRLDDGLSPRASFCPLQSRGTLLLVPPVAVTKNGTSQLKVPCQINANSLRYNG